jgi:hypothetical protein
LAEYVEHYNGHRPHRSLELRAPRGPTAIPAVAGGQVVRRTRVHGGVNGSTSIRSMLPDRERRGSRSGRDALGTTCVGRGRDVVKPPTSHLVAIVSDRCSGQTAPSIN